MPEEPTQQDLERLHRAIFARRKVEAIKLYRKFSGRDLKESKDYIETLTSDLILKHPGRFAPRPKGWSLMTLLLFLVILAAFSLFLLKIKGAENNSALQPNESFPTLRQALDSKQDLWGLAAMRQTNGPSYEFFEKLLPPLRYVNAAFRHYPIVLSAPGAPVKARLISNGSAINARANLGTWKESGMPISFHVGTNKQTFGEELRRLRGPVYEKGYLPIVHLTYENDGAIYEQETFAATESPLAEHGVVFVQFKINGKSDGKILAKIGSQTPLKVSERIIRDTNGAALVWFGKDWKWNPETTGLETSSRNTTLAIATAAFEVSANPALNPSDYQAQKKKCISKWESILSKAMVVDVPEPLVNAAWKSTIIGTFMLLHGDHMNYSAGNAYDVMYEVECGDVVRALMKWGLVTEAQKMIPPLLDYGINPGLRFHDSAFKLQLISDYYWFTRDADFVQAQKQRWLPSLEILTKERDAKNGLLPAEDYCGDIHDKVFSLNSNANGWRGLRDISAVLEAVNEPAEAQRILGVAQTLREATLSAVEKSERHDVPPPFIPIALFGVEKPYDVLTSSMLGSYWDLMIPFVIGARVFDQSSEREDWMLRYLEQHGGVCMGMIRFHQHSGLFANEDGLDDCFGLRYTDALLRRDEPERALVSFYGKLAQGMTRDTFLSAEGTGLKPLDEFGRPMYLPPTSTGAGFFLTMLRSMLVQDYDLDNDGKPETLRMLFATPKRWLENGKEIKIENAPTAFGDVSIHIKSHLNKGEILAEIKMPQRNARKKTLFRLRVPDGWKIISAAVNSKSLAVDEDGTMDISNLPAALKVRAKVKRL
jgi:hypothetical protein